MTSTEKGGRPFAPRSRAEVLQRISCESVGKARPERLRVLYRLLRSFVAAEQAEREDRRIEVQNTANELKSAELVLMRSEYRRRFAAAPLGQQSLLRMVERLEAELTQLKNDGMMPIPTRKAGDRACQ